MRAGFTGVEGTWARLDRRGCGASSVPVGLGSCWTPSYSCNLKGGSPAEAEDREEHECQTFPSHWRRLSEPRNPMMQNYTAGSAISVEAGLRQQSFWFPAATPNFSGHFNSQEVTLSTTICNKNHHCSVPLQSEQLWSVFLGALK